MNKHLPENCVICWEDFIKEYTRMQPKNWDAETEDYYYSKSEPKGQKMITKQQLLKNKFYIGSKSILNREGGSWGHETLEAALEHASQMLAENKSESQVFIVEIVRVVKRKPIEVTVETVE